MQRKIGPTRRDILKSAAAAPVLGLGARVASARNRRQPKLPNVVLFMTDQERRTQHFPPNWERKNLPGLTWLKKHGVTFCNAYTNSCMCSPARSTWMTGFFPAQHGVKYTLEESMPAGEYPQVELSLDLPNIGRVMAAAGYNVVYKGKWHCSKPQQGNVWVPEDVNRYGFSRWNPQDAGANQNIDQAGGGTTNNDGRFMFDDGPWEAGKEGAIPFLKSEAAKQQPFFLIVSLVNPHDVLFYPKMLEQAGYDDSWLAGDIRVPRSAGEDLSTKPSVQRQFRNLTQLAAPVRTRKQMREYLNFYGNLIKSSDKYLVDILTALEDKDLLDDTWVIKTADHGEMGMTHGRQIQKNFNFYQETTRIPLIYSHRGHCRQPATSGALVSHVDFLPTIASLFNAPDSARTDWQGVDYSCLVRNPNNRPVQDYVVFTFDDFQSGQPNGPYPQPPNHIVSIIERRYKLAEYYDVDKQERSQWEMYDILRDPDELCNLAAPCYRRTRTEQWAFERLRRKLRMVKATRLHPLA